MCVCGKSSGPQIIPLLPFWPVEAHAESTCGTARVTQRRRFLTPAGVCRFIIIMQLCALPLSAILNSTPLLHSTVNRDVRYPCLVCVRDVTPWHGPQQRLFTKPPIGQQRDPFCLHTCSAALTSAAFSTQRPPLHPRGEQQEGQVNLGFGRSSMEGGKVLDERWT